MTDRSLSRLAGTVAAAAAIGLVVGQVLMFVLEVEGRGDAPQDLVLTGLILLLLGIFLAVGGVVASRRARHPVGWLLLVLGVLGVTLTYGELLHGLGPTPWWRSFGAWLDAGLWHPSFPALGLLFLLFPTGDPPSPRWRWLLWSLLGAWLFLVVTGPFTTPSLTLEFYPDANALVGGPWSSAVGAAHDTVQLTVFGLVLSAVASMVVRGWRSRGLERQQLKWFAASTVTIAIIFPTSLLLVGDGRFGAPFFVLLPLSCGVAILRYRLFDIDRVISRTVTYALVIGLLVGVYIGGVLALGSLVPGESELSVAVSTLAVAALFNPLRRRVQAAVDRRFNRSRYDGERELQRFSNRLRDELDLDTLGSELAEVAAMTMEPTTVSLWLRDDHVDR